MIAVHSQSLRLGRNRDHARRPGTALQAAFLVTLLVQVSHGRGVHRRATAGQLVGRRGTGLDGGADAAVNGDHGAGDVGARS